ncbi:MAG: hypothetical protein OEZ58_04760 [Gammaproteobacteria bacterium]|nr:hypothetical protein [Gammaproteobacteria bacterium]MDH5728276.1 hypothetical protein [Gammaproteobacteria bacterium]
MAKGKSANKRGRPSRQINDYSVSDVKEYLLRAVARDTPGLTDRYSYELSKINRPDDMQRYFEKYERTHPGSINRFKQAIRRKHERLLTKKYVKSIDLHWNAHSSLEWLQKEFRERRIVKGHSIELTLSQLIEYLCEFHEYALKNGFPILELDTIREIQTYARVKAPKKR